MNHDSPPTVVQTPAGALSTSAIPACVVRRLQETCRANGATLDMALLAAFGVLLYRRTGQSEVAVATPALVLAAHQIETLRRLEPRGPSDLILFRSQEQSQYLGSSFAEP